MSDALTRKLEVPRRKVGEMIATFNSSRDESTRLVYLERALEAQREVARLDAEFTASLEPCKACDRKVTTPCHTAENYFENGPWDGACAGIFNR